MKYTIDILHELGKEDSQPINTPVEVNHHVSLSEDEEPVDQVTTNNFLVNFFP